MLAPTTCLAVWLSAAVAAAQPAPTPAPTPRKIAVAPLATLGAEATAKETGAVAQALESALAAQPGVTLIGAADVGRAVKAAKRPELRVCDGDVACLGALGGVAGAELVVYGELGGLGDAQVVYLTLVDVAAGKELRSTTYQTGDTREGGAVGAAVRLLAPERYVGRIALTVDVTGATAYVNGRRVGKSPLAPLTLPVGTHALRVTHPEFRDFVRFVDVGFDATVEVAAGLQQYPVIATDVNERPGQGPTGPTVIRERPAAWYRRWWVLAAGGALLAGTVAIIAGVTADGLCDDCPRRPID